MPEEKQKDITNVGVSKQRYYKTYEKRMKRLRYEAGNMDVCPGESDYADAPTEDVKAVFNGKRPR